MQDLKINQLPISNLTGNELFPIWGSDKSNQTSIDKIKDYIKLNIFSGTSNQFLKADGSLDNTNYLEFNDGRVNIQTDKQAAIVIDTTATMVCCQFRKDEESKGYVGWLSANGVNLYNYICNKSLGLKDDGTPHYSGNKLWHEGNDGSGSGLDADLLDGINSSGFIRNIEEGYSSDLDAIALNGKYKISSAATNKPGDSTDRSTLVSYIYDEYNRRQLYFNGDNDSIFTRRKTSGIWATWHQLAFTDSNVASADKLTISRLTNEDLNDIKASGDTIESFTAATNNTCLNKPTYARGGIFTLLVYKVSSYHYQLFIDLYGDNFKRVYGTSWSAWKKMLTEDDESLATEQDIKNIFK